MLYIIGTPIGNLQDMSPRAVSALKNADTLLMESPQDSLRLLQIFEIPKKPIIKYNDANAKQVLPKIKEVLQRGSVTLITSAGMPGVSDPGFHAVKVARELGIEVQVIPGPSAVTSVIALCGMPVYDFAFVAFLPRTEGKLKKLFEEYKSRKQAVVFFESPFRIQKSMKILETTTPEVPVFLAKELTKKFESSVYGTPKEINTWLAEKKEHTKGEFVGVIGFHIIKNF
ncbi:MAG: 16S rRNA (cytidine(1402)-2'-O)-methyltransferase [Patescibacteria group bacterium]|nr:16S rRNA (cytidine(1402)-2'-O)-methyltransferase [Patescibacteria group bacterium]